MRPYPLLQGVHDLSADLLVGIAVWHCPDSVSPAVERLDEHADPSPVILHGNMHPRDLIAQMVLAVVTNGIDLVLLPYPCHHRIRRARMDPVAVTLPLKLACAITHTVVVAVTL